jgi:hypothetical protein
MPRAAERCYNDAMERPEQRDPDPPGPSAAMAGFVLSLASVIACGFLSLPALAVSLMGLRKGPRRLAAAGVALSILTGVGWGVALWRVQRSLDELVAPSLAEAVWTRAIEVAELVPSLREREPRGRAAELVWQGAGGAKVAISAEWSPVGDIGRTRVEVSSDPTEPGEAAIVAVAEVLAEGEIVLSPQAFEQWLLAPFDAPLPGSAAARAGGTMLPAVRVFLEAFGQAYAAVARQVAASGSLPSEEEAAAILAAVAEFERREKIGRGEGLIRVSQCRYRRLGEERYELAIEVEIAGPPPLEAPRFGAVEVLRSGEVVAPRARASS